MARLIYLDAEEEVTDLVDRLRDSDQDDVVFVLPARARALQSRLNVGLLQQYAQRLGKRPVIITPDPVIQGLSTGAGFPTFATITAFEQGLPVDPANLAPAGAMEFLVDDSAAGRAPAHPAARTQTRPVARPAAPGLGLSELGDRRLLIGVGAGGLVILLLIGLFWVPTATIVLSARTEPRTATVNLVGSTNPVADDQKADHLQDRQLSFQQSASNAADTTGRKDIPAATASGTVRFSNQEPFEIKVSGGCIVATSDDAQQFSAGAFTLPAGTRNNPGQVDVTATATAAGAAANVAAGLVNKIDCQLNQYPGISVTNPAAMSGGQDARSLRVLSQADVDNARKALQTQLAAKADQNLQAQLAKDAKGVAYEKLLDSTLVDAPTVQVNHQVGEQADNFNINVTLKRTEVAVNEQQIRYLVKQALRSRVGHDESLLDDASNPVQVDYSINDAKPDGTLSVAGTAQGFVVARFDAQRVRNQVAGKSPATARGILVSSGNSIQGVEIRQSPYGLPWLPFSSDRITVQVVQVSPPRPAG